MVTSFFANGSMVRFCSFSNYGAVVSPASTIKVRVGEHDQNVLENQEIQVDAGSIFKYPSYQGYNYDVALIKLSKRVRLIIVCVFDLYLGFCMNNSEH